MLAQTVWLPRFYASIQPFSLEAPRSQPPKGVEFPDPLSGTLNKQILCMANFRQKPLDSRGLPSDIIIDRCNGRGTRTWPEETNLSAAILTREQFSEITRFSEDLEPICLNN